MRSASSVELLKVPLALCACEVGRLTAPGSYKINMRDHEAMEIALALGQISDEQAQRINPLLRGRINYYGHFYKSALYRTFQHLNNILARWASRKYKRLKGHKRRAFLWLQCIARRQSRLFVHWQLSQVKAGQ